MKKVFSHSLKMALAGGALLALTGCGMVMGEKAEVPSGHIGKVSTKEGFLDGFREVSRFRLDRCFAYCDSLVLLPIGDRNISESFKDIFMPEDDLRMSFSADLILSPKEEHYDFFYSQLIPRHIEGRTYQLPMGTAYDTWAKPIIRTRLAEFVSQYSIDEIASNLGDINEDLRSTINASIEGSPFTVKYIAINPPQLPTMILDAKEKARERIETVKIEQGQKEVDAARHDREMAQAEQNRLLENKRAEARKEANDILSESVSPQYVTNRMLDFLEQTAGSDNKMIVPVGMLDDIAGRMAAYQGVSLNDK